MDINHKANSAFHPYGMYVNGGRSH